MANKARLQDRCAAAGLSIEGTKNDLKARLKGSSTVNLVETIIHKNAVQVPQSDEASKAHSWLKAIERESRPVDQQCAQQVAPFGAIPRGCSKLDITERRFQELTNKQAEMAAELSQLKISHKHSLSITDRFFSSFLRGHLFSLYSSSEYKRKAKGDCSAHHVAPQLDALLYTNHIRSDESTFIMLYGVPPGSISLIS